jgi:hypothetical protein
VRDAVARVKADLPAEMRDPTVTKTIHRRPRGPDLHRRRRRRKRRRPLDDQELSWFVDNTVPSACSACRAWARSSASAACTAKSASSSTTRAWRRCKVSALDVSRQLRNVQREAPGGRGDVSGAEQSVRTIATVQDGAELARMDIPLPDGRRVRLDQVATVSDTVAEPRAIAEQDGRPVVGFEVFRTKGASEIDVAAGARAAVAELQKEHPTSCCKEVIDNAFSRCRKTSTARWSCCTKARSWRCWWCGGSCATGAPRWWPPPRCRCR